MTEVQDDTQLGVNEPHPSAHPAYLWFHQSVVDDPIRYIQLKESIASTALSGNRLSQVCLGTMNRLEAGQPVSDRYLLGLVWFMRDLYEGKYDHTPKQPKEPGLIPDKEVTDMINVGLSKGKIVKRRGISPLPTKNRRKPHNKVKK